MSTLSTVRLHDGTRIHCMGKIEAMVLDGHVTGYLKHGVDIGKGAVVIDAGANIGLFCMRVLERCGGDATVLAFEPVPPIFAALERNAARFGSSRFKVFRCGLSSHHGTAEVTYYPRSPALSTAHPEVYDEDPELIPRGVLGTARHAPAGLSWARFLPAPLCRLIALGLRGGAEQFRCELRTLSDVIKEHALPRVDLLKVDVEGEELEVLRGIEPGDWPLIRQAVVEVHDKRGRLDAVRALLYENGLVHQTIDQEEAFQGAPFYNVYATRRSDKYS